MLNRLLERGKTSGREDDNVESIKKRFRMQWFLFYRVDSLKHCVGTYTNDTMPVIKHFTELNKVKEVRSLLYISTIQQNPVQIDSSPPVDEVYATSCKVINGLLESKQAALKGQ